MKIDKKAINYYYSFFEVSKDLNQKQFYDFNMAIMSVMFFDKHIDEITFNDQMLTILWKSVKHSVYASVKGYCDKKSIPYDDVFVPLSNPLDNKQEGQEKEKEQEKEQEKDEAKQITNQTAVDIATFLYNNIQAINPSYKKPNLNTWAKDIDLAMRVDGRTVQQLVDCINWIYSPKGTFWQKNILSGKKLREKFDTMNMQVISTPTSKKEIAEDEERRVWVSVLRKQGLSDEQIIERMER